MLKIRTIPLDLNPNGHMYAYVWLYMNLYTEPTNIPSMYTHVSEI